MLRPRIAAAIAVNVAQIPRIARPDRLTTPGADGQPRIDRFLHPRPDLLMPPAIATRRRPAHQTPALAAAAFSRACVRFRHRSSWKRCFGAAGTNTTEQSGAAHSRDDHISSSRSTSERALRSRSRHQSHASTHSGSGQGPASGPYATKRRQRPQLIPILTIPTRLLPRRTMPGGEIFLTARGLPGVVTKKRRGHMGVLHKNEAVGGLVVGVCWQ
jgi:hypothetical protein